MQQNGKNSQAYVISNLIRKGRGIQYSFVFYK